MGMPGIRHAEKKKSILTAIKIKGFPRSSEIDNLGENLSLETKGHG